MEIIEIGTVMVAVQSLKIIDEFQTFIKPVRYPVLTEFCKSLTSITQEQVDQAPSYVETVNLLKQWLSNYPSAVFGSWGDYDRNQFKQDSKFHNIPCQFEGWGIFQPTDEQAATLIGGADLPQIVAYLQQLPTIRLRLAYRLQNQSWLAYPFNEDDLTVVSSGICLSGRDRDFDLQSLIGVMEHREW